MYIRVLILRKRHANLDNIEAATAAVETDAYIYTAAVIPVHTTHHLSGVQELPAIMVFAN